MSVIVTKDPPLIVLTGPEFEPEDGSLAHASTLDREMYWRQVALYARDEKYRELHRALDVNGQRLVPRLRPRHDRATGPVLDPHWSDSRFQTELRWKQDSGRAAVLYWLEPWAKVVAYHAQGIKTRIGRIVRDVIGLTGQSVARIQKRIREWWASRQRTGRMGLAGVTFGGGRGVREILEEAAKRGTLVMGAPKPLPSWAKPAPKEPMMPAVSKPMEPWKVVQSLHRWWIGAGVEGQATEAQAEKIAATLARTQSPAVLVEVARRLGVERINGPADAIEAIRLNLIERVRSARPMETPPPPPPAPEPKPRRPRTPKPKPAAPEAVTPPPPPTPPTATATALPILPAYVPAGEYDARDRALVPAVMAMPRPTLVQWAARILAAARSAPESERFGEKVFLSHVAARLGITPGERPAFDDLLVRLNREGLIDLVAGNLWGQFTEAQRAGRVAGTSWAFVRPD